MIDIGKVQRKAHEHYLKGHRLRAKMICKFMRVAYACEIPYTTDCAADVHFWHGGLGVVIGSEAVIKSHTEIMQNVTIGARGAHRGPNGEMMPLIGENVRIYSGAIVLGPITVGDNAVIGAGSVVLKDVPPNAVVAGNPARILRYRKESEFQ